MKEFFNEYLQILNEDISISSKYIDKKYFCTINHNDIFYKSSFFNFFPKDMIKVNEFINKFIAMAKIDDLKSNKEFLVYDKNKNTAVIVDVYIKGSFRHDIILMSSFNTSSCPSIQKTGQCRIIF